MKVIVVGASGATGKLLVENLLHEGQEVVAVVRSADKLPEKIRTHKLLTVVVGSILEFSDEELKKIVANGDAVASCLGHNLTFKGMYGYPRKLVTDATKKLCLAVEHASVNKPIKFVLMNTAGNKNKDCKEPISFGQRVVIGLLRLLVPPVTDNEKAAEFLRVKIGQHNAAIQWAVVRPDNLLNDQAVSAYKVYASPIRSAIFNAGQTSRINVAHFMADLITKNNIWQKWCGKMPVIYNEETQRS